MNGQITNTGSIEHVFAEYEQEMLNFDSCSNINKQRMNSDKSANNYGSGLIEFLKTNNLYILNGRTNGDLTGKCTCKDVSTVDYFICNSNLFKCILSLNVLDFNPLYSDAHNPVTMTIFTGGLGETQLNVNVKPKPRLWDKSKTDSFVRNLDINKIDIIFQKLNYCETTNSFEQNDANDIVNDLSNLLMKSAKTSFCHQNSRNINVEVNNHDYNPSTWFGPKCKKARRDFHRARYLYKLRKSDATKNNLRLKCNTYKQTMNFFS